MYSYYLYYIPPGTTFSCDARQFSCPSGYCIPLVWVCDGDNDCSGGEDEYCCE